MHFRKIGECLYRYSNEVYYGRIQVDGKEIKRSLQRTDRELARRKLADFRREQRQIDRSAGKLTLDACVIVICKRCSARSRKRLRAKVHRWRRLGDRQTYASCKIKKP